MQKNIYRLITSKNYLKLVKIYHEIFGEKFKKNLPITHNYNSRLHRLEVINNIIKKKNSQSYLEIGCDQNEVFSSVSIKKKIGIDPISGGTHRMTSDNFFKINSDKFDLIFIDGLHRYAQVKKDIENSLSILNQKGVILIHDCMPFTFYDQACPRAQRKWNGDVWKAIVELRTKNNLTTCVGSFDNGIGMVIKEENHNLLNIKVTNKSYFEKLTYEEYYNNFKSYLNLVDEKEFYEILNGN